MSHTHSNTDTWFELYFEERFAPVDATLQRWSKLKYHNLDDAHRDEALQRTRIIMWEQFSKTPEEWAAKPKKAWSRYCQTVYHRSIYSKKERTIHKWFVNESDLETPEIGASQQDTNILALVDINCQAKGSRPESRDMLRAETRVDLTWAIQRGFRMLEPQYHDDMRKLMRGIMEGYTQREMIEQHGWSSRYATKLKKLLRTVFFEALTGEKPQPRSNKPSEKELAILQRLAERGLSERKIGARLGRSSSWARDHIIRLRQSEKWPRGRGEQKAAPVAAIV